MALLILVHTLPRDGKWQDVETHRVNDVLMQHARQNRYAGRSQIRNVVDEVFVEKRQNAAQTLKHSLAECCARI